MSNKFISIIKDFDFNNQKYRLYISHAEHYTTPLNPVYFLDANSQNEIILYNNNECDGASILYVGIGYQEGVDILPAREKDYTIKAAGDEFSGGGGAQDFLIFIRDVVKPYIENTYDLNLDRQTLAGHSFGGHFVLYAAFNNPEVFQNYVSASPAIWYGNGELIPDGELQLEEGVNRLCLMIGEYEENVHPEASSEEADRVRKINSNTKLRVRNLSLRLISNEQRCDFIFCPGYRHPGVIKEYAKLVSIVASQNPKANGL